ncbi:MAG: hypothetical protein DRH12_13660 [Deltaproteobacteria bacterium]|nr:MAG: hypothetical protein DRH12_13660 [Deltaproteobacteria bacterium]
MYLAENLPKALVPKYYGSVDNLIEDAYRALLNLKPGLKVEMAVEIYRNKEVSLWKAADMAGTTVEEFKEILRSRGFRIEVGGSKEESERRIYRATGD